ncbi:MAG TPA: SEC-C metal-binding domain-containing protein [Planctomycetota bacterium]|nr:SEC-C metal-binding domain-containing protein [Planctomycetota bacterium]
MVDSYTKERIENWVGDFAHGDRAREFAAATVEFAPEILTRFLAAACDARGAPLEELSEEDLRAALLGDVAKLDLSPTARRETPALCAAFLSELEREGRIGGGRALGSFVRALQGAFEAANGPQKPFVRPGSALSRNDPCPCGSGKKYKKCCQRLLDK